MRIIQVILCAILFQVSYQRHICQQIESDHDISMKDAPFLVFLKIGPAECSGIVISPCHILTAKNCLDNLEYEHEFLYMFLGSNKKYGGKRVTINKSQESLHPDQDMAIIHLRYRLQFSDNINAISLPTWSDAHLNVTGKEAFITGWGYTLNEEGDKYDSETLLADNITISLMDSKEIIFADLKAPHVSNGSPLIINQTLWGVLIGISNDEETQYYCSVAQQLEWISETTGMEFKN